MKKQSILLSLGLLVVVGVIAQTTAVTANQETKPNPPIPSETAKDLLVPGAQDDDAEVQNPPISKEAAKDLLLPGVAADTDTVENPPIPQDVANALTAAPVKTLPKTSAVPNP